MFATSKLPPGVTAVPDEDLTVFLVSEPTVAEEPVVRARRSRRAGGSSRKRRPRSQKRPRGAEAIKSPALARGACYHLASGRWARQSRSTIRWHPAQCRFLVAEELGSLGLRSRSALNAKWDAEVALFGGRLLMKPQTFMNPRAARQSQITPDYRRIDQSEILVIVDDAAIRLGELRLRPPGSAGGTTGSNRS